jgi:hypothetical protein
MRGVANCVSRVSVFPSLFLLFSSYVLILLLLFCVWCVYEPIEPRRCAN